MSRTAHLLLASSALVFGLSSQAFADETRTADLKDFTAISIDGLLDLNITQGDTYKVEMSGKTEALDMVNAKVRDGELRVNMDDNTIRINSFSDLSSYTVTLNVTMPTLNSIDVDGLSDVIVKPMAFDGIKVKIDGKADVKISGTCNDAYFRLDGLSDFDAKELKCKNVKVDLDGLGTAKVYASEAVDASVDGLASVAVYGEPQKRQVREEGFGDVKFKN